MVLVDDSIVRGTTCARIVRLLREAGATEVHMRVSSPPFLHPCYFGTDVDSQRQAHRLPAEQRRRGDRQGDRRGFSLGYLSVEDIRKIADGCGLRLLRRVLYRESIPPAPEPQPADKFAEKSRIIASIAAMPGPCAVRHG